MSAPAWWWDLPRTEFGSPEAEERLAALVIAGRKRASAWAAIEGEMTQPGMRWVVTAAGRPVCVIETVSVTRRRFDQIDAAFAALEGEGDRSLDYWRLVHEDYFRARDQFAPEMEVFCEEFRLVETIDQDLAAAAAEHVRLEEAEARQLLAGRAQVV